MCVFDALPNPAYTAIQLHGEMEVAFHELLGLLEQVADGILEEHHRIVQEACVGPYIHRLLSPDLKNVAEVLFFFCYGTRQLLTMRYRCCCVTQP